MPDRDIYFRTSWFRENPPLKENDRVTYELRVYGDNHQATEIERVGEPSVKAQPRAKGTHEAPKSGHLFNWAYVGYMPSVLSKLKGLALKEDWEFKNAPQNPDRPYPILRSYLMHTFGRLVLEKKVMVNSEAGFAAFNTGLVDPRYESIYAIFVPNSSPRTPWQLVNFCIAGEGRDGQSLVRHFNPLPEAAHYFDSPVNLLYDIKSSKPELDWKHVVIERIERYPASFVEDHWPPGFERRDTQSMTHDEKKRYFSDLGGAIEADTRTYRRIISRVKDAIDLSIKRVAWNFKTAIPTYYPPVRKLQLLLPICLVTDETVDLALAVEKTPVGSYLGHTVLPLDWAYNNARLVCRPDSDWLSPKEITTSQEEDDDLPQQ
jgi:hypothetical protein